MKNGIFVLGLHAFNVPLFEKYIWSILKKNGYVGSRNPECYYGIQKSPSIFKRIIFY